MSDDDPLTLALMGQARACAAFGSTFYRDLLEHAVADLADPALRGLFAPWAGRAFDILIAEAAPIRFLGALHDLALSGAAPELTAAFPPAADAPAAWRAARAAFEVHGEAIAAFMSHEPQTNEVRRSAALAPGLLTLAHE